MRRTAYVGVAKPRGSTEPWLRSRTINGLLVVMALLSACTANNSDEVTAYISLDRPLAEPILRAFEETSELEVNAVFDTEANKTSGLVNRLIAEASRPRADLFWNNETAQLQRLADAGVVEKSSVGTGHSGGPMRFAARMRVIIQHRSSETATQPLSILAFSDASWRGQSAIGNPRFGTTGTHFAALLSIWGEQRFREWLRELKANDVAILPGNAQVKDAVAAGRYAFGLTDTDDANAALLDGQPVQLIVPDQSDDELGVFVVPNEIALVKGRPHPENGRKLAQFLLSADVERVLAEGPSAQIPIRNDVPGPLALPPLSSLKVMEVDYEEAGRSYETMLEIVDQEWPR